MSCQWKTGQRKMCISVVLVEERKMDARYSDVSLASTAAKPSKDCPYHRLAHMNLDSLRF